MTTVDTVQDLLKLEIDSRDNNSSVLVQGYSEAYDDGGGIFAWEKDSLQPANGGTILKSPKTGTGRWVRKLSSEYITPEMFGAVGDGIANDTDAFQSCLDIGGNIKLSGRYLLNHVSGGQSYYKIVGTNNAVLDFSQSDQDLTNSIDYGDFELKGSYEQISDLSVSPTRFSNTVTFATAHNLKAGDLFVIWNDTNGSWNPMRTEYQAGEICEVKEIINSTEVETMKPLYDGYDSAVVKVYKMNTIQVKASNFKIIGGGNPPPLLNFRSNYGFQIGGARDVVLNDIQFEGSFRQTLHVAHAYNVSISDISISHTAEAPLNNYGLMYSSCQNTWITNCTINAIGDSIETSSGIPLRGSSVSFPVREATVRSVTAKTIISQHGHAEYGYVSECFSNGITLGGDRSHVENCYVTGNIQLARESVGMNFTAIGNIVKGGITATQCADAECRYPTEIQKIRIQNNIIEGSRISLPGVWSGGANVGYTYHIFVESNKIINDPTSLTGAITTAGNGDSTADYISIKDNDINGHLDIRTRNFGYKVAVINNNTLRKAARSSFILHYGSLHIKNNLMLDISRDRAISLEDTNMLIGYIDKVYIIGNTIGDTIANADGAWLSFYNTVGGSIYMQGNDNLNQPSKEIVFGVNSSMSDIKPYFTGKANPNQGKATILSGATSVTITGLDINTNYLNIQLTGTNSETANAFITNVTSTSFDITVGTALTGNAYIYWKLEG